MAMPPTSDTPASKPITRGNSNKSTFSFFTSSAAGTTVGRNSSRKKLLGRKHHDDDNNFTSNGIYNDTHNNNDINNQNSPNNNIINNNNNNNNEINKTNNNNNEKASHLASNSFGDNDVMIPIAELDHRLDPGTIFFNNNESNKSLGDEHDYSRRILKIANPE